MCTVSMVMDGWNPLIPQPSRTVPWPPYPNVVPGTIPDPAFIPYNPRVAEEYNNEDLRKMLDAFMKVYEGAKAFDEASGQPDCEDPEKTRLLERVEELERRLDALEDWKNS